ncbi:MAG: GNAT family N-acetyltransferase [Beijerinckiaceae bacterium]
MIVTFEDHGHRGRYILRKDGHEAELSVSKMSETLWIVDHTGVPDALGGQGIGKMLAERAVSDARASGRTLRATCPFFLAQAAKHPEWADVVKR